MVRDMFSDSWVVLDGVLKIRGVVQRTCFDLVNGHRNRFPLHAK